MTDRVVGVVQARLGSTRLPAKVLEPIGGRPMVLRIADRLARALRVDTVVLSTSDDAGDDPLAVAAERDGLAVCRGPVDDIVGRLAGAAATTGATTIVRVWGDCPFIDPAVVDRAVAEAEAQSADYVTNSTFGDRTFPPGLDLEVYSTSLLARMDAELDDAGLREFPAQFAVSAPDVRVVSLQYGRDLSALHLTVDYPADLAAARVLAARLAAMGDPTDLESLLDALASAGDEVRFGDGERNIEYRAFLAARRPEHGRRS